MSSGNILLSGVCGCPGAARGRVILWTQDAQKEIQNGDIIVLRDASIEVPVWAIRMSGGIVSCEHTSYSHLVSAATFLNKPCIVGARFSVFPTNFCYAVINAFQCAFYLSGQNAEDERPIISQEEKEWYRAISGVVRGQLLSKENQTLAHIVTADNLQNFAALIDGVFLDATIFQKGLHEIPHLIASIAMAVLQYPKLQIRYRFSKNPVDGTKEEMRREIEFIKALRERGVEVSLFFPNATTYRDIERFKRGIAEIFFDSSIKIGAMMESRQILNDIERIAAHGLIDFAIVGINDFMSSCLGLERNDSANQSHFSLDNPQIRQGLARIVNEFGAVGVPCYIGYPKYSRFLEDMKVLTALGYKFFFGTPSLFELVRAFMK